VSEQERRELQWRELRSLLVDRLVASAGGGVDRMRIRDALDSAHEKGYQRGWNDRGERDRPTARRGAPATCCTYHAEGDWR